MCTSESFPQRNSDAVGEPLFADAIRQPGKQRFDAELGLDVRSGQAGDDRTADSSDADAHAWLDVTAVAGLYLENCWHRRVGVDREQRPRPYPRHRRRPW